MAQARQNTRDRLIASTIRLVCESGVGAATTRAIAREAGVTEGAIYRHYRSKEELSWHAYKRIVEEMIHDKQTLASSDSSIPRKLREWIRLTYAYFDDHPQAFTYVLLMPPPPAESDWQITTQQGRLFTELMEQARAAGQIRDIASELATSHFTGVMLNVPRLINEGTLEGPASRYIDDVADSVWRMLRPETGDNG